MDKIEIITKELLFEIGEDPRREGLIKTPTRVSKSWKFLVKGYDENIDSIVNGAIFSEDNEDMIIVKDINYYSLCEHHLLPFMGKVHIGYIPDGKVLGLSKLIRIVEYFSRRPQVQERLTEQIIAALAYVVETPDVAVYVDAEHFCVKTRGVQDENSSTVTLSVGGIFAEDSSDTRREFLKYGSIAATGFFIVPRHVLGGNGYQSPSDTINIGGIGVGGKGTSDIWNASIEGKENVIALCDVNKGDISAKSRERFPNANFYQDYREMLDKEKDLDALTISTPDHMHAIQALAAMDRGINVYVQKPLTHNIREARMLTETAIEKKIVTQMGNQGASNSGMIKIQEWFNKGLIGAVDEVYVWTNRTYWRNPP